MRISARAQCPVQCGRDGETRGQNASNLGLVPFLHRVDKRLFISLEQLLALLCILGLAGGLGLRDQAEDVQDALWFPVSLFQMIRDVLEQPGANSRLDADRNFLQCTKLTNRNITCQLLPSSDHRTPLCIEL